MDWSRTQAPLEREPETVELGSEADSIPRHRSSTRVTTTIGRFRAPLPKLLNHQHIRTCGRVADHTLGAADEVGFAALTIRCRCIDSRGLSLCRLPKLAVQFS